MDIATQKINRAAAAMAVSNYGHSVDEQRVLDWKPDVRYGNSPRQEICDIAGHLMESDEHEEMFADEADSWAKTIVKDGGLLKFAETFSHHKTWLTALAEL